MDHVVRAARRSPHGRDVPLARGRVTEQLQREPVEVAIEQVDAASPDLAQHVGHGAAQDGTGDLEATAKIAADAVDQLRERGARERHLRLRITENGRGQAVV